MPPELERCEPNIHTHDTPRRTILAVYQPDTCGYPDGVKLDRHDVIIRGNRWGYQVCWYVVAVVRQAGHRKAYKTPS